ncbi:MAG: hypothetical protein ACOC00_05545 [Halothiobacillaceae bacterium]
MELTNALYVIVLAASLGLVLFQHWARPRKARIVLVSAVLASFVLVAGVHGLATAEGVFGQVLAALAVLFGAQGATAAFVLLWREMEADRRPGAGTGEDEEAA